MWSIWGSGCLCDGKAADCFGGLFFGASGCKDKGKSEIRGSLRCAVHDETVNCFGRDDGCWGWGWGEQATAHAKADPPPSAKDDNVFGCGENKQLKKRGWIVIIMAR
jgi:hypothetical protein